MSFLNSLTRRFRSIRQTPEQRAEDEARAAAKRYWEREVAEERERRGTPEDPPKER